MHAAADRNEFIPPQPPGTLRALGLALLAHLLLLGALTWGVHWKRQSDNDLGVEAELWSAVPQQAAPRLVEPPPPPSPPPAPPEPAPRPAPPPRQAAPDTRDAEIAVEREKKRLDKEKQERLKQEQERRERAQAEREKQAREKERERLKQREKQEQLEKQRQLAEDKKKQEQEAKRKDAAKAQEEGRRLEAQRQENLRRIAGLAGATGGESASGTAQRSAGPSAGYAGRIRARIKPNIVFTDDVAGNPTAEVEVRVAPDGTIVSRRLIKSSGLKAWDEAALKAIDKTEVLPRDVDGRVPQQPLVISFRPKD